MPMGKPLTALCAVVGLCLASAVAWAGEIRQVALDTGATGTRAEIALSGSGGYKTLTLAGPNRLVVDFPDSTAIRNLRLPTPKGVVTAVRTGQPVPGTFRVVFDLAESVAPFRPQMRRQGNESTLVIEWPGDGGTNVASTPASAAPTATVPASTATPASSAAPTAVAQTPAPTPADSAQARNDAARATALLTASVRQQASATAAAPLPTPAPTTATANVAAAGSANAASNSASPAAILAGQPTAAVVAAPAPAPVPASTTAAEAPDRKSVV